MKKIKVNTHQPFRFPEIYCKGKLEGFVTFIGDFSYKIDKQKDTNKLVGLSDNYHHHKDSVRIGWRWNEGLEIMAIIYSGGKRVIEHLAWAKENIEYKYKIVITENNYHLKFNDTYKNYLRLSKWSLPRVVLNPYFGGTTKAPKTFRFRL